METLEQTLARIERERIEPARREKAETWQQMQTHTPELAALVTACAKCDPKMKPTKIQLETPDGRFDWPRRLSGGAATDDDNR